MPLQPTEVHGPITRKPPPNFDPIHASPDDLRKALYPPRPDPETTPKHFALWRDIAARKPIYVGKPFPESSGGLDESDNWSGAVLSADPRGFSNNDDKIKDPFKSVTGWWIIPNAHPKKDAQGKYVDGEYRLWTWVGLDGWTNKVALKAGVTSSLTVQNGTITKRSTDAAILYRNGDSINFKPFVGFTVEPGDLVAAIVWRQDSMGKAHIYNQGRNTYSNAEIEITSLEGATAEWIAAGRNPKDPQPYPFPNYGATFFFNGLADHESNWEESLSRAQLVDAQDVGSYAVRASDQFLVHSGALKPPIFKE
ncbi:hypothetical protein MMC22_010509 [Lobaria immixta]|nr:hypothetical protein [Lobaria immixta]